MKEKTFGFSVLYFLYFSTLLPPADSTGLKAWSLLCHWLTVNGTEEDRVAWYQCAPVTKQMVRSTVCSVGCAVGKQPNANTQRVNTMECPEVTFSQMSCSRQQSAKMLHKLTDTYRLEDNIQVNTHAAYTDISSSLITSQTTSKYVSFYIQKCTLLYVY